MPGGRVHFPASARGFAGMHDLKRHAPERGRPRTRRPVCRGRAGGGHVGPRCERDPGGHGPRLRCQRTGAEGTPLRGQRNAGLHRPGICTAAGPVRHAAGSDGEHQRHPGPPRDRRGPRLHAQLTYDHPVGPSVMPDLDASADAHRPRQHDLPEPLRPARDAGASRSRAGWVQSGRVGWTRGSLRSSLRRRPSPAQPTRAASSSEIRCPIRPRPRSRPQTSPRSCRGRDGRSRLGGRPGGRRCVPSPLAKRFVAGAQP